MKLLFDEHLSHRLVALLGDLYPDSESVLGEKLGGATDSTIVELAARRGFVIVTKDQDIPELILFDARPLKAIWVKTGNCSTSDIHLLLRNCQDRIMAFATTGDRVLELP